MTESSSILTAARKSELALCEQLSRWESLPYGVAFWSEAFPDVPEANQLRDVWLADVDGGSAYLQSEAFFGNHGVKCGRWTPASGQPVEPVAELLLKNGWTERAMTVLGLATWQWLDATPDESIRILPARAMPKAFRATFEVDAGKTTVAPEIASERLNDSRMDVFVAMHDGKPAGRVGYLQVGDVARLTELWVVPDARGSGVGRAMAAHVCQLARRLLPKEYVACCDRSDNAARKFLERAGFEAGDEMTYFERLEIR